MVVFNGTVLAQICIFALFRKPLTWSLWFLDLRQDMLTLQMIQLMDVLWKREGLDLRFVSLTSAKLLHLHKVENNVDHIRHVDRFK